MSAAVIASACCPEMAKALTGYPDGKMSVQWLRPMQIVPGDLKRAHIIVSHRGIKIAVWVINHCPWCGGKLEAR